MEFALWLDASLPGLSLAILSRSPSSVWKVVAEHHDDQLGATSNINSILSRLLIQVGVKSSEMTHLLVGVGPGSFTGIKVGMAWAFGFFAGQSQLKICGLSALNLAATGINVANSHILLKVTGNHGFMGSSFETYSEAAFERADLEKCLRSKTVYLANAWPEVFENLLTLSIKPLQIENLRVLALKGLLTVINSDQIRWEVDFPQPRYLKQSTAEEKLVQIKEQKNG
jgi:tRNA A37 threonylcarbamoyladenosine modification protein TsaB